MSTDALIQLIKVLVWPTAFVISIVTFLLLFRKQITALMSRLVRIKAPYFEAGMSKPESGGEAVRMKEEQIPIQVPEQEKKEEQPKTQEPATLSDWRSEIVRAVLEKDRKRLEHAYEQTKRLDTDDQSRKRGAVFYWHMSYSLGDASAISQLRKLSEDPELAHEANMALGNCYFYSDDFKTSSDFFDLAYERASSDDERSSAASRHALSLYHDSKKEQATQRIINALAATKETDAKIILYETLADIYEKENDFESRAFVLDKAIELRPNDSSILFKAAYSYSQCNYDDLSLLHYKNARAINPKNSAMQNNLGVQYDRLKMPIKCVSSYREAHMLGGTLASANLANRLINAGFRKEAEDILNSALSQESVDKLVNSTLSEIPNRLKNEDSTEEQQDKSALKLRKYILAFASARFTNGDGLMSISGLWKSNCGTEYELKFEGQKLVATWKQRLFTYEYERKFEGHLLNSSAILTFYTKELNYSTSAYEYKKKGSGLLYTTQDDSTIEYLERGETGRIEAFQTLCKSVAS